MVVVAAHLVCRGCFCGADAAAAAVSGLMQCVQLGFAKVSEPALSLVRALLAQRVVIADVVGGMGRLPA